MNPPDILAVLERPRVGRKKKPPTEQIRLGIDVVELAWRVAVLKGYRQAGDYLTDLLRPMLKEQERELLGERAKEITPKRKPKGGE